MRARLLVSPCIELVALSVSAAKCLSSCVEKNKDAIGTVEEKKTATGSGCFGLTGQLWTPSSAGSYHQINYGYHDISENVVFPGFSFRQGFRTGCNGFVIGVYTIHADK